MNPMPYAELHCLSNFSFLRGAAHPQELVARAHALGYTALALTDECSLSGVVRAHDQAKALGLALIIGCELALVDGPRLVLLVRNRAGYARLCRLITRARRAADKGAYLLCKADLESALDDCLALLPVVTDGAEADVAWFARTFAGRGWLAVELVRDGWDERRLALAEEWSQRHGLPQVAAGGVVMHTRARRALHDVLTAIRLNVPVAQLGGERMGNGERHLRHRDDLAALYPPALLAATLQVAALCDFSLHELRYEYPDDVTPAGMSPCAYLRRLTEQGMVRRWPDGYPARVRVQIEHELALIAELRYEPYFLTVWDIVRHAREHGILCQGRGSAANSAVCYCLGITEVDPARMNMLFERFLSRERNEPPDIDVDFEHERREEVIQYIYRRYGRERAALAATVITYRSKSALRDVGKALGLGLEQVEALVAALSGWRRHGPLDAEHLAEAGFDPHNRTLHQLLVLVNELRGFPRHLSQHVGGFVITRGRLDELVPIENAAMPDRSVIQWEKDDLESLGLLKIDVLALGMLSAIRRGLAMISGGLVLQHAEENAGAQDTANAKAGVECERHVECDVSSQAPHICVNEKSLRPSASRNTKPKTMADIPAEDPAVYAMIQRGDTMGVFQIESRAQMAMLPRLRPACFYDLVIEVAIVRPGPIQGDMVHPYLRRRQGIEAVDYPSAAVREVLERTLGVPIFQEQVIKLAMVAAGFSPGEADQLRRSMAAWRRRGGLEPYHRRLLDGMCARGYSEDFAERVYRQILGFGEYGFPESHAASFALLVYVSAWLKCHHPAIFCAALINSQPMGFYQPAQLVRDAREHGVMVLPAQVNAGGWDCSLESGIGSDPVLRLGLCLVRGLSHAGARRIEQARAQASFADVADLARRAQLDRGDLRALAAADALLGLAGHRHAAAWAVAGVEESLPLLAGVGIAEVQAELPLPAPGQAVLADYAHTGLSLRDHPLALLRNQLRQRRLLSAAEVATRRPGQMVRTAGLVLLRQRPGNGRAVFVTLEDESGTLNLLIWADLAERQRKVLLGASLLGVIAEIQREAGVQHLLCRRLEDHSDLIAGLEFRSRDFQ